MSTCIKHTRTHSEKHRSAIEDCCLTPDVHSNCHHCVRIGTCLVFSGPAQKSCRSWSAIATRGRDCQRWCSNCLWLRLNNQHTAHPLHRLLRRHRLQYRRESYVSMSKVWTGMCTVRWERARRSKRTFRAREQSYCVSVLRCIEVRAEDVQCGQCVSSMPTAIH